MECGNIKMHPVRVRTQSIARKSLGLSEVLVAHNFFQFTGSEKQSRNAPPAKIHYMDN
jgi:hypothetical protein